MVFSNYFYNIINSNIICLKNYKHILGIFNYGTPKAVSNLKRKRVKCN